MYRHSCRKYIFKLAQCGYTTGITFTWAHNTNKTTKNHATNGIRDYISGLHYQKEKKKKRVELWGIENNLSNCYGHKKSTLIWVSAGWAMTLIWQLYKHRSIVIFRREHWQNLWSDHRERQWFFGLIVRNIITFLQYLPNYTPFTISLWSWVFYPFTAIQLGTLKHRGKLPRSRIC